MTTLGERYAVTQPPIAERPSLPKILSLNEKIALAERNLDRKIGLGEGITGRLIIPDAFNATSVSIFRKIIARKLLTSQPKPHGIDYNDNIVYRKDGTPQGILDIPSPDGTMPDRTTSPEDRWNYEDLRTGPTMMGKNGVIESVLGGTAVPPVGLEPTTGQIITHPMILRIHEDENHNLVADTPFVIEKIKGKNTIVISATENSAIFLVREDSEDDSNKNAVSIYEINGNPDDYSLRKLDVLRLPTIDKFNNKKSGTAGSLVKRENDKWIGFIHGQTDARGKDRTNKTEYKLRIVETDGFVLRVGELMITRAMLEPISPREVELRPEKIVVYSCDSMRIEGKNAKILVSIGDINTIELTIPLDEIDRSLAAGEPFDIHAALKWLNGDRKDNQKKETTVFEPTADLIPAA